jgi:hypothetical protein
MGYFEMKKAQIATEYLIVLFIVIIIVLIVGWLIVGWKSGIMGIKVGIEVEPAQKEIGEFICVDMLRMEYKQPTFYLSDNKVICYEVFRNGDYNLEYEVAVYFNMTLEKQKYKEYIKGKNLGNGTWVPE